MTLEEGELSGRVIGAAIAVHRALGPGFVESVYQGALEHELNHRGVPFVRQLEVPVFYRGQPVGRHKLDLFVADTLVVELKAVKQFAPEHFAVVRSYLHAIRREHGLLLNFSRITLEMKRVIAVRALRSGPPFGLFPWFPAFLSDPLRGQLSDDRCPPASRPRRPGLPARALVAPGADP